MPCEWMKFRLMLVTSTWTKMTEITLKMKRGFVLPKTISTILLRPLKVPESVFKASHFYTLDVNGDDSDYVSEQPNQIIGDTTIITRKRVIANLQVEVAAPSTSKQRKLMMMHKESQTCNLLERYSKIFLIFRSCARKNH